MDQDSNSVQAIRVSDSHPFHADPDPGFEIMLMRIRIRIPGVNNLGTVPIQIKIQGFICITNLCFFTSKKHKRNFGSADPDPYPDPDIGTADADPGTAKMRIRIPNPGDNTNSRSGSRLKKSIFSKN